MAHSKWTEEEYLTKGPFREYEHRHIFIAVRLPRMVMFPRTDGSEPSPPLDQMGRVNGDDTFTQTWRGPPNRSCTRWTLPLRTPHPLPPSILCFSITLFHWPNPVASQRTGNVLRQSIHMSLPGEKQRGDLQEQAENIGRDLGDLLISQLCFF